jgi:aryl-alcohol dehydrogenase-like predicted oxidoreductase
VRLFVVWPMERQLVALKDLQAEGKIKHIGLSEVSVRQLRIGGRSGIL